MLSCCLSRGCLGWSNGWIVNFGMWFFCNCHICYCRLCFTMFIAEYFVTDITCPVCFISGFCTGCGFCFYFCQVVSLLRNGFSVFYFTTLLTMMASASLFSTACFFVYCPLWGPVMSCSFYCHICYCRFCFTMFIAKYFVAGITCPVCYISSFCTSCSFRFCLCHRMTFCLNCHICYCRLCFTKFIAKYFVTGTTCPVLFISSFCTGCGFRFCFCHFMT